MIITLRPAGEGDAEALAGLIVQLYNAEAPGVLRGPHAGHLRLFQEMIGYEVASGTRGRYLAIDDGGQAVGTASVRIAGEPGGGLIPPGIVGMALRSVGPANTLRMLSSVLRAALFTETPLRAGEAYIYSVVVAEGLRGMGLGRQMMEQIEDEARHAGARAALLRVIVGNQGARRLYERLGYRVVSRTPSWADRIAFPTQLMRKELG